MSKAQEKALRIVGGIGTAILVFGIAYGTMKTEMSATTATVEKHEVRIDNIENHMVEQRTDIKWIRQALEDR